MTECIPARKKNGEVLTGRGGRGKARWSLQEREGPPPFEKAVCRHLCANDSTAPNGFVCVLHTVWGTASENAMDRSPEMRAKVAKNLVIAGKIGGKISVQSPNHISKSPNSPAKLQVTCPHCGKTGNKMPMLRWHLDRCKFNTSSLDHNPLHDCE